MLEDQLLLRVGFQDNGIFVKRAHAAGDPGAVQQMHCHGLAGRKGPVEKRFLDTDDSHDFYGERGSTSSPGAPRPGHKRLTSYAQNSDCRTICPIYNWTQFNRL